MQLASVAKFRNGLFALVDDYEELKTERQKAKAEEREKREREQNEEKERGRQRREIEALRAKLEEAQQSLEFLQKERQETQQQQQQQQSTLVTPAQESPPRHTELLQELKSQNLELEASLDESTQKSLSLQRCLEGKCAIIEAMSKEIQESQELLARGWEELGDTKKQVCELAQGQYDTIRKLKQLESDLKKKADCNLELEGAIEEERKQRKELSQAKSEMEWQLSTYRKQMSTLTECNKKLEGFLHDKERVIEEQSKLTFRGQQIQSTVQELQIYVGKEEAESNDYLQLHLMIKI